MEINNNTGNIEIFGGGGGSEQIPMNIVADSNDVRSLLINGEGFVNRIDVKNNKTSSWMDVHSQTDPEMPNANMASINIEDNNCFGITARKEFGKLRISNNTVVNDSTRNRCAEWGFDCRGWRGISAEGSECDSVIVIGNQMTKNDTGIYPNPAVGLGVYINNTNNFILEDNTINGIEIVHGLEVDVDNDSGNVIISRNQISGCDVGAGINIQGGENIYFAQNNISNNDSGIVWDQQDINNNNTQFYENTVTNNLQYGARFEFTGFDNQPDLQFNTFENNGGDGIRIWSDTAIINVINNNILGNGGFDIVDNGTKDVNAQYNWWGTTTTTQMSSNPYPSDIDKIFDKFDSVDIGNVIYNNWRTSRVTGAGSSINGTVFNDRNNNGIKDVGERGLRNCKVYISGNLNDSTTTNISGGYSFTSLAFGTYYIKSKQSTGWVQTVPVSPDSYTVNINLVGSNVTGKDFGKYSSESENMFTSFVVDSICQKKPIKLKNSRVSFCANFTNDGQVANGIRIKFNQQVLSLDSSGFTTIQPLDAQCKTWELTGRSIDMGEQITICGIGSKARSIIVQYWWWIVEGEPTNIHAAQFQPAGQIFMYPMPNFANVREETFRKFTNRIVLDTGMVLGIVRKDNPRNFGWVRIRKQADMQKSLLDRTVMHTSDPRGFNRLDNGRSFVGELKKLSPLKHDNRLFAQALTLKFNIIASAIGTTQPGFGELIYDDGGTNPLNGYRITQIDSIVSRRFTYFSGITQDTYNNLDTTIAKINAAFSGPLDTVSVVPFVVKGVRELGDVPFLSPSNVPAKIIASIPNLSDEPYEFELLQNYPNPFNPTTTIEFNLPEDAMVTLKVYNVLGQEVKTLVDEIQDEGYNSIEWDSRNYAGNMVSSGIYFYRIKAVSIDDPSRVFTQIKKMVLLR